MKKNKMMRLASCLLVMVLLTTSMISGTFAKYTTSAYSEDKARVAYWGFQTTNTLELTDLFKDVYGTTVDSIDGADVIAPGTSGTEEFAFVWDDTTSVNGSAVAVTGPEVTYDFTVKVEGTCDDAIKNNANIVWSVDGVACASWDDMIAKVKALSGDASGTKQYDPNTLPPQFNDAAVKHTIGWEWKFDTDDAAADAVDTAMGNAEDLADCNIKITITATQVD